jgi:hypothetical protein
MTKERLQKKVEGLKKQKEEAIATVNLISGAILFSEQLLQDYDKPEEPEATPMDKGPKLK